MVTIDLEEPFGFIKIFPIPALNKINLVFSSNRDGAVEYEMMDILGTLVKRGQMPVEKRNNNLNLSMEALESGIYF